MLRRGTVATIACMVACWVGTLQAQQPESAQQLVREVVYNEQHDHNTHGYWRYWIRQRIEDGTRLSEQVETHDGPVTRWVAHNGKPLSEEAQQVEQTRLDELVHSSSDQADHRQAYEDDEKRVARIMALLPDAFVFEDQSEVNGIRHLRFRPNPNYSAHTIEARVFHAMTGELWINVGMKRMVKLEGSMTDDLNFGFGLLGHVNRGSWFRMNRIQVSPTEWKTNRLEVHFSGRAMLFKTIARETSEERGGFAPVPAGITLAQGVHLLAQSQLDDVAAVRTRPASFTASRP